MKVRLYGNLDLPREKAMRYLLLGTLALACGCSNPASANQKGTINSEVRTLYVTLDHKMREPELAKTLAPLWTEDLKPHTEYPLFVPAWGATNAMVLVWDVPGDLNVEKFVHRVSRLPGVVSARCGPFAATDVH